jgi:hypothetical protein
MGNRGWFADPSDEYPELWQAFLQAECGCFPLDGIWFESKDDCEQFIVREVLGKEMI